MPPRPFTGVLLAPLALLLVATLQAGAEPIQWTYTGNIQTDSPYGAEFGPRVLYGQFPDGAIPSRRVEFADASGNMTDSGIVIAFRMQVVSGSDDPGGPYIGMSGLFKSDLHQFGLRLKLNDVASGAYGGFWFPGSLEGEIGAAPSPNGF